MYKVLDRLCFTIILALVVASFCGAVTNPPICPHVIGWNSAIATWAQGAPWIKVIYSGDVAPAKATGAKVFYRPWDADSTNHDDGCLPSTMTGTQYADLVWAKISPMTQKPDAVGYRNEFNWTDPACSKRTCQQFISYYSRLKTLGYTGKVIFGSFGVGWVDDSVWNDSDLTNAVIISNGIETHEYFDLQVSCGAPYYAFRHRDIALANHSYLRSKDWYIGEFGSDKCCASNLACSDYLQCRRGWRDKNKLTEQAYIDQMAAYRAGCASQVVAVFVFQQGDSYNWSDFETMGTNPGAWMRSTWGLPSGRFVGTVRDAYGTALSNASISITPGLYSATGTSTGVYTTPSVPSGTSYSITVTKTGYAPQTITRTLATGDNTLDFSLTPMGSSGGAKRQSSGNAALTGVVVGRFPLVGIPDRMYVEDQSRAGGICVLPPGTASPSDLIQVQGTVYTNTDGERVLKDATFGTVQTGVTLPKPYAMSNLWLGGGAYGYQAAVLNSNSLLSYAAGLNNVGVLCRAWGTVTYVDTYGNYFYVNDGSKLDDGSGRIGIRVASTSLPLPGTGANVSVTGVSSTMMINNKVVRVLKPRCVGDLSYAPSFNNIFNAGFDLGSLSNWTSYGRVDGVQSGTWYGGITAKSGSWFFGNAANWDSKTGGIYQRVIVKSGTKYLAKAYSRVYWSGSTAPTAQNKVGIDPTGGIDPNAATVSWSAVDTQSNSDYSKWVLLTSPTVTAGDTLTIFLDFKQTDTSGWHINCFDEVGVYYVP